MNEDNVIDGVINYLKDNLHNRGRGCRIVHRSYAEDGDHGIDIKAYAISNSKVSTRYYIEAKGTLTAKDDAEKKARFDTEFRFAISQIILRMKELSGATIYGIAVPMAKKEYCLKLLKNNKGLKALKLRLYFAYKTESGEYFAEEMTPKDIYK